MGRIERRKRKTWLQFWWGASDTLAILAAFPAAYWLRFHSPLVSVIPVVKGVPALGPYVAAAVLLVFVWLPLFRSNGLYEVEQVEGRGQRIFRVLRVGVVAVVLAAALTFFYRGFSFSRAFFPLLYVCLVAFVLIGRRATGELTRRWRERRPLRIAVVGESASGMTLASRLVGADPTGVVLCGRFISPEELPRSAAPGSPWRAGEGPGLSLAAAPLVRVPAPSTGEPVPASGTRDLPVLGSYTDVGSVVASGGIDALILAFPLLDQRYAEEVVTACRTLPVDIELVPDTFQLLSRRAGVREVDGLPVLSLREFPLTGWNVVRKRAFDLSISALALLLLSPLFLVLALAVKLSSPGPLFYRQERLGRDGRLFHILKFRSMRLDAEEAGPVWAVQNDARRTGIGTFMRQWSLDELPQLVNVLKGEMSLVGPRPERPHFVRQFAQRMPDYLDRQRVKSGITGWAQVNGLRGDTSIEERTRYDVYYVENWSLLFDVKILLMTAGAVLGRRGAY